MWEGKKGDWLIIDGGLKSGKIVKEARKKRCKIGDKVKFELCRKAFRYKI